MDMPQHVISPPPRSKRVQAWVYTVINPSIEGLRRELLLLEKGNLTWRFYSQKCEYIRPTIEYVETSQLPNYEDFLAEEMNAGFRTGFERHDVAVSEVESTATLFFEGLMQSGPFEQDVQQALEKYASKPSERAYVEPGTLKPNLSKYAAEYLINQIEELPDHYLTQKFWEVFRTGDGIGEYMRRDEFHRLKSKSLELERISRELLARLESHRFSLCRTFDIPAAPLPQEQEL